MKKYLLIFKIEFDKCPNCNSRTIRNKGFNYKCLSCYWEWEV